MNRMDEKVQRTPTEEMKKWFFRESVRIQNERQELQELQTALQEEKRKIAFEKETLKRKAAFEDKRFQNNERLMDAKQRILEDGFRKLHADKQIFEQEQKRAKEKMHAIQTSSKQVGVLFFSGVDSSETLKKRYKDLLKIYHPDNSCGDEKIVLQITKEYEILKKQYM